MSDMPEYRTGELPEVDPSIHLLVDTSDLSKPTEEDGDQPPEISAPPLSIDPEDA